MNVKETTINERFVVEKFTTKKFHELLQVQSTKKATICKGIGSTNKYIGESWKIVTSTILEVKSCAQSSSKIHKRFCVAY